MPDAFEWSAICEMSVAFANPRLSCQAFFKTWTNLKKQVVSKKPGSKEDVMTGTMTFVFPDPHCRHQRGAQDTRRFIAASTLTDTSTQPSFVAGRDPPDFATIAARFLPSSPSPSQHSSSPAPPTLRFVLPPFFQAHLPRWPPSD